MFSAQTEPSIPLATVIGSGRACGPELANEIGWQDLELGGYNQSKEEPKEDQFPRMPLEPLDQAIPETLGCFSSMSPDFPFGA